MANDNDLPWICDWVAHPLDGAFIALLCAGVPTAVALTFCDMLWVGLAVGLCAWLMLFGGYMVARRVWDLGEDVPLSFGFDLPCRLPSYCFLNVFLARRLAGGSDSFEVRDVLSVHRLVTSATDGSGKQLFVVVYHGAEDGLCVSAIERSLAMLCSEGVLQRYGSTYCITQAGRQKIESAVKTAWERDEIRIDALADLLGFDRSQALRALSPQ